MGMKNTELAVSLNLRLSPGSTGFFLFLFCVYLFYLSILTDLFIGEFFLVTLGVFGVVQVIGSIVRRDFSFVE